MDSGQSVGVPGAQQRRCPCQPPRESTGVVILDQSSPGCQTHLMKYARRGDARPKRIGLTLRMRTDQRTLLP